MKLKLGTMAVIKKTGQVCRIKELLPKAKSFGHERYIVSFLDVRGKEVLLGISSTNLRALREIIDEASNLKKTA